MKWNKNNLFIASLIFTCVAFPLMQRLVLDPFEHNADFELSDFYERTAARSAQEHLNQNIVLVAADKLSREGIVNTASALSDAGAALTVIDIHMDRHENGDDTLAAALSSCRGLVLPLSISEDDEVSLYDEVTESLRGSTELSTPHSAGNTIRRYCTQSDKWVSLAGVAASAYVEGVNYDKLERLISYKREVFDRVTIEDIAEDPSVVMGRIAIIGDLNSISDVHETPVGDKSGAEIQAHIIDTILANKAPSECPLWIIMVLSLIICTLLFWRSLCLNILHDESDLAALFMRLAQFVLLILIYNIGAYFYIKSNLYVDFSIMLLLIGAESLLIDITLGIRAICFRLKYKKYN